MVEPAAPDKVDVYWRPLGQGDAPTTPAHETYAAMKARIVSDFVAAIADPTKIDATLRKAVLTAIYQTAPDDPVWTKALAAARDVDKALMSLSQRIFGVEQALVRLGASPQGDQSASVIADRVGALNERFDRIEQALMRVAQPQQQAPRGPTYPSPWQPAGPSVGPPWQPNVGPPAQPNGWPNSPAFQSPYQPPPPPQWPPYSPPPGWTP